MPTVPVYIRKEDWDKWISIEKPSEFIHNALNADVLAKVGNYGEGLTEKMLDDTLQELANKGIKPGLHPPIGHGVVVESTSSLKSNRTKPSTDLCKQHGIDKNLCRMMKH